MSVQVFLGDKEYALSLPDEIPELDDEQLRAGDFMFQRGSALLFSDPGAGKTLTALHALVQVEEERKLHGRRPPKVLIVVPTIAIRTWAVWIKYVYQVTGHDAVVNVLEKCSSPVTVDDTHVIVTYGMLSRDATLVRRLQEWGSDVLICDESDNLVGLDSARTRAVYGHDYTSGLAKGPFWAWFLTGTPLPRYHDGLYPVLRNRFAGRLVAAGLLDKKAYLNHFCYVRRVKFGKMKFVKEQVAGSRNEKDMYALLFGGTRPIAVRNKLNLDKPIIRDITLEHKFSKAFKSLEMELIAGNSSDMMDDIAEIDPRATTALRIMGEEFAPAVAVHVNKTLQEMRKDDDRTGILLLYWHKEVGNILFKRLKEDFGWLVGRIDGSTTRKTREEVEDEFNSGMLDVCLGQIKAMGVALNLQKNCHRVGFAEETFSATMDLQAYQRVWRRGQERQVIVDFYRPFTPLAEWKPRTKARKSKSAGRSLDKEGW